MRCDRGGVEVAITLAPTIPAKVQYLTVRRVDPGMPMAPVPACPVSGER
jgi:hypothetical protein